MVTMVPSDSEDAEQVEIVYAYVRTDPDDPSSIEPRTRTVSATWYDTWKHADEVLQRVKDKWIRKSGVRSVSLGGGESHSIVVAIDQEQTEIQDEIPDTVDDVPVKVEFIDPSEGYPL